MTILLQGFALLLVLVGFCGTFVANSVLSGGRGRKSSNPTGETDGSKPGRTV